MVAILRTLTLVLTLVLSTAFTAVKATNGVTVDPGGRPADAGPKVQAKDAGPEVQKDIELRRDELKAKSDYAASQAAYDTGKPAKIEALLFPTTPTPTRDMAIVLMRFTPPAIKKEVTVGVLFVYDGTWQILPYEFFPYGFKSN